MTRKEQFLQDLNKAISNEDIKYFVVYIDHVDCDDYEEIINPRINFEFKRDYYGKAYDDNMELGTYNKIKVVDWKPLTNWYMEVGENN